MNLEERGQCAACRISAAATSCGITDVPLKPE
jgi:hypothetical protein